MIDPNSNSDVDTQGREAEARAIAWARMKAWVPYGATEAAPRTGTAPDAPYQGIPRLRGEDACR
jgi:hypothetical protein